MGLTFKFVVPNAKPLEFAFRGFNRRLEDFTDVWPKIARAMEGALSRLFATEGASGPHGPWPALTEKYLKRKYKKYGAQQIEVASGRLRRALTDSTSGDAIREYQRRSMRFGTSLPYAIYQQTGWELSHFGRYGRLGIAVNTMLGIGPSKRRRTGYSGGGDRVPPRRVIDMGPAVLHSIIEAAMIGIDNKARASGLGTGKRIGLNLGPGEGRLYGYGLLTGKYLGEGGS